MHSTPKPLCKQSSPSPCDDVDVDAEPEGEEEEEEDVKEAFVVVVGKALISARRAALRPPEVNAEKEDLLAVSTLASILEPELEFFFATI